MRAPHHPLGPAPLAGRPAPLVMGNKTSRQAQTSTRTVCPDRGENQNPKEAVERMLEAELAAVSKS